MISIKKPIGTKEYLIFVEKTPMKSRKCLSHENFLPYGGVFISVYNVIDRDC